MYLITRIPFLIIEILICQNVGAFYLCLATNSLCGRATKSQDAKAMRSIKMCLLKKKSFRDLNQLNKLLIACLALLLQAKWQTKCCS